jgi:anti-sigma regulatory factor (Ser/Thr protein kinase)
VSSIALELPANKHAPALARQVVREIADAALADEERWRVELIVSELVANAVAHGPGGPVELAIEAGGRGFRGQVADPGQGIRTSRLVRRRAIDDGGRGLFLVDALSDTWGFAESRSRVWFEVVSRA